jgi:hypothetical protein
MQFSDKYYESQEVRIFGAYIYPGHTPLVAREEAGQNSTATTTS